jgi:serine O-acetyltransferase
MSTLTELMKKDLARYEGLHYLHDVPRMRQRIAALRHRGLRTIWYFRLRSAAVTAPLMTKPAYLLACAAARLILRPSVYCEIPPGTDVGGGCFLPHPLGVVLAPQCRIGCGASIFSGVVLGVNHMSAARSAPVLGDHVTLYAGAKVIGGVTIGDHAVVGANAVVTCDVAPCAVVAGVPARVIASMDRHAVVPF